MQMVIFLRRLNETGEAVIKPTSITIEYPKCKADCNYFKLDFGSNDIIRTVANWQYIILLGKYIIIINNLIFINHINSSQKSLE